MKWGKILIKISFFFLPVFILCHSVKWVPNIYELLQSGKEATEFDWPVWIRKEDPTYFSYYTFYFLQSVQATSPAFSLLSMVPSLCLFISLNTETLSKVSSSPETNLLTAHYLPLHNQEGEEAPGCSTECHPNLPICILHPHHLRCLPPLNKHITSEIPQCL